MPLLGYAPKLAVGFTPRLARCLISPQLIFGENLSEGSSHLLLVALVFSQPPEQFSLPRFVHLRETFGVNFNPKYTHFRAAEITDVRFSGGKEEEGGRLPGIELRPAILRVRAFKN
jgi:hypothetical protein